MYCSIYPEMELKQLRHEIQIQLVTKDVPKTFLFLRLVGKSLAQVKDMKFPVNLCSAFD